ncbi:MAG: Fic family protein [Cytophagaceae bacterium]|jgi:Fic family protein|nr:Fic family protein [Cytophagaceae bacterium]
MRLEEILKRIEDNQNKISSYGKFSDDVLKKINYKLRLDWNYYSNRMEGGTLTREETRSVMVGNIDVKGKPFKDVTEMNGHDKIVLEVLKMSNGADRISEKRIKDIHKAIMHEEDPDKVKEIGNWKSYPNEIINYRNEKIEFTSPGKVAEEIHSLLNRTNAYLDKFFKGEAEQHPIEMISQFHNDYLLIHPFYDGNGRTARILTNILLLACGYPVIIIKEEVKKSYYQLLADIQVYDGMPNLFYQFIGERIIDSQKIILDALEGKPIDEPGDLDKKIALLEKELESVDPNEEVKVQFSKEYLSEKLNTWMYDLIKKSIPEIQKFNKFFNGTRHHISLNNFGVYVQFVNETADEVFEKLITGFENNTSNFRLHDVIFTFYTSYGTLIKGGLKTFGCNYSFEIKFDQIKYEVFVDEFTEGSQRVQTKLFERLLHKPITEGEMTDIVGKLTNAIYDHIDFYTKKNGLR